MRRRAFLARVWAKLLEHERRHRLLVPGSGVVAGVSGGPDSVCLAHYLSRRSRKLGFPLILVHVHHGLRGRAADRDAALVERLGAVWKVPVQTVRADVRGKALRERRSLEDAARVARYAELGKAAARLGFRRIATAHTLSDHAETLVLHLLRGTEPKGLLGIPIRRPLIPSPSPLPASGGKRKAAGQGWRKGRSSPLRGEGRVRGLSVVRPLRCLTREEVLEYLRFFKLSYRVDASNRDEAFTRNWVRRRVIPLLKKKNPRLEEHLGALSEKLRTALSTPPLLP